ncbi:unnamed protein product, partial [Meganyctiphanes norvegica]
AALSSVQALGVTMKFAIVISAALTVTAVFAVKKSPGPGCIDMVPECPGWAADGECEKNPGGMRPNCPKSCGMCGKTVECVDTNPDECVDGWVDGDCTNGNRIWMFFNCPKTCGTCDVPFTGL